MTPKTNSAIGSQCAGQVCQKLFRELPLEKKRLISVPAQFVRSRVEFSQFPLVEMDFVQERENAFKSEILYPLQKWPLLLRHHCNNLPFLSVHMLDTAANYFVVAETDSPADYLLKFQVLIVINKNNHPFELMHDLNSLLCAKLNAAAGTMADIYGALLLNASFDGSKDYTMVSVSFRREHEPFLAEFSSLCTSLKHFLVDLKQYVDERFPEDF
ncbi:hypothetical protein niasHT_008368 [Heterodera trifolii]|uniref:Uncharacterized protein n=1 Tax=Heterodera trifolii TaxID=157864 RepID=A0ABD2M636_9BILA